MPVLRPIVFFVAACSLSGSFYLKQHESEVPLARLGTPGSQCSVQLWDRAATFMMSARTLGLRMDSREPRVAREASVFLCMLLQAKPPSQHAVQHAPVTPPLQFRSAQIMGAWAIQTQLDQREWEAGAGMISGPKHFLLASPPVS